MRVVELNQTENVTAYVGVVSSSASAIVEQIIYDKCGDVSVVFLSDMKSIEQWILELGYYNLIKQSSNSPKAKFSVLEIMILPQVMEDTSHPGYLDNECDLLTTLNRLTNIKNKGVSAKSKMVVLTTPDSFFQKVQLPEKLVENDISLKVGQNYSFKKLIKHLSEKFGYSNEVVCETPGQFAVRGGLVDVYPVNSKAPCRLDFFGNEIESIRYYDPTTQRTVESIKQISITGLNTSDAELVAGNILHYFDDKVSWVFFEPDKLIKQYLDLFTIPERINPASISLQNLFNDRIEKKDSWFFISEFQCSDSLFAFESKVIEIQSHSLSDLRVDIDDKQLGIEYQKSEEILRNELLIKINNWRNEGFEALIILQDESEEAGLRNFIRLNDELSGLEILIFQGDVVEGFAINYSDSSDELRLNLTKRCSDKGIVVVTGNEIYSRRRQKGIGVRRRKLPNHTQIDHLLDFSELVEGDHVVHILHGICIYRGITLMDGKGKREEMITLEFENEIVIYLPLRESHLLSRYVGLSKVHPKLGKVGGSGWENSKRDAEIATLDYAARLLNLQAERSLVEGYSFAKDNDWQKDFENAFPFQETKDQLTTSSDIKSDMEMVRPMDRLLCGDVGFGKTEVAMRAAFKAVMDGKQVIVIAPTTVLSQQHFNSFRERISKYPVVVEMLSRFRTPKQQRQIIEQTKLGQIDILIGTHRLLSKDVIFNNPGLLIIDEEHRFGVKHKEKLKQLWPNIDILSMSATPIPRTLYFALMGARDLSVIETPPVDRLPIQTLVKRYDMKLVKDAISFEIQRGGQVFYLHNRVDSIESVAKNLQDELPDIKIAVGHGKMGEHQLEKIMTGFVANKFDVLVCTTIIESGLDIPNCNTIIIEGADRFGLSQLYQLRGRVGRFNRQAVALLLLHRNSLLQENAQKRLSSIKQFNQLGAGFRIAMRDLELRGSGNLLGSEQSGHIAGIGFDLYCQLLRQSISRLKGEKSSKIIRANVRLDFIVVGQEKINIVALPDNDYEILKQDELSSERIDKIEAYIPADYIGEIRLRIEFYRQLSLADNLDRLNDIKAELVDRFGNYPIEVEAVILITEIRCLAENCGIMSLYTEGSRLKCLKATGKSDDFIKNGTRFPRLTEKKPLNRLKEIIEFLRLQCMHEYK